MVTLASLFFDGGCLFLVDSVILVTVKLPLAALLFLLLEFLILAEPEDEVDCLDSVVLVIDTPDEPELDEDSVLYKVLKIEHIKNFYFILNLMILSQCIFLV